MNVDLHINSKINNPLTPSFVDIGELGYAFRLTAKRLMSNDPDGFYVMDDLTLFMLFPETMDDFLLELNEAWAEFKQKKYGPVVIPNDGDLGLSCDEFLMEPNVREPAGVGHF